MIRLFTMDDYEEVYHMWKNTSGVGFRNLDDSKEGIAKFVKRNDLNYFNISMDENNA